MTTSKEKNWFKSETYNFNDNHKCDEYPDQIDKTEVMTVNGN